MRINEALILEVEKHLTADVRPGIVDSVYDKIVREWTDTISEDDKLLLHISKLLLEYEVNFLTIQAGLMKDLIGHRITNEWGKKNFDDWDALEDKDKANRIANHLAQTGALANARKIYDTIPKTSSTQTYRKDVADVKEFRGKILRTFLESFT